MAFRRYDLADNVVKKTPSGTWVKMKDYLYNSFTIGLTDADLADRKVSATDRLDKIGYSSFGDVGFAFLIVHLNRDKLTYPLDILNLNGGVINVPTKTGIAKIMRAMGKG